MNAELNNTRAAFDRYEEIRHRLPRPRTISSCRQIGSLLDISDRISAFVFDAFGVLNVGETPIPGAAKRVQQLREAGCAVRVLTNAASYQRPEAVAKFARLGVHLEEAEIVTSRDATLQAADARRWGVIAAPGDDLTDVPGQPVRLGQDRSAFDAAEAFLFLSAVEWSFRQQEMLLASLAENPREVLIANADLVAPRDTGLSLEPGFFGHQIADRTRASVAFYGKPFPDVFKMAEATLPGIPPNRIAMCGDTLHTDILGGIAAGWRTVLVTQDGLFAGADVGEYVRASGIRADWSLPRI